MRKLRSLCISMGFACSLIMSFSITAPVIADSSGEDKLELWQEGDSGEPLNLRGRVISPDGRPIEGALVQVRQADGDAQYVAKYQGSLVSGERGSFTLQTVVPGQYTSAKHVHIRVTHPDYQELVTEILFKGDPNISFGMEGALEVLLEQIHQGEKTVSVGGVEIMLQPR